jgi:DNA-directed RNA polymerase specialized sigma24 family protein
VSDPTNGTRSGAEDGTTPLSSWLVANHDEIGSIVRRRAGKLLLRLETVDDLVQGICAHVLSSATSDAVPSSQPQRRAWLLTVSERWLSDRRSHWSTLKRRGGEVLRLALGESASADFHAVRDLAASVTGPSTFASRREQLTVAALALDLLLPRDRELVEGMCSGLDLDEQARRLGVSYAAAQRGRLRALERFRSCFEIALRGQVG